MEISVSDNLLHIRLPDIHVGVVDGERPIRLAVAERRKAVITALGQYLSDDLTTPDRLRVLLPDVAPEKRADLLSGLQKRTPINLYGFDRIETWPVDIEDRFGPGCTMVIKKAEFGRADYRKIDPDDEEFQRAVSTLPAGQRVLPPAVEMTHPFSALLFYRTTIPAAQTPLRGTMHHLGCIVVETGIAHVVTYWDWDEKSRTYLQDRYKQDKMKIEQARRREAGAKINAIRSAIGTGNR